MESTIFQSQSHLLEQISKKRANISPIKNNTDDSKISFILKDHREQLISKRKEFINNYRKKQRLLSLVDSNQSKKNTKSKNIENEKITIEDVKNEIDPISRIKMLKIYIRYNNTNINLDFINNNLNLLKECFNDFKKYLFDYKNNNLNKQIKINIQIIYNILSLLFEPEINPIIEEFNDYDFLFDINTFCFHYLNLTNEILKVNSKDIKVIYFYILFLINNLITVLPDEGLIKSTINIKEIIQLYYEKFFFAQNNNNNNNLINNNCIYNEMDKFELLEFSFFKLIENCIVHLHLDEKSREELLTKIVSLLKYNYYYNNDIKLLIYNLECLTIVKNSYLLLEIDFYNNFIITALNDIMIDFDKNDNQDLILLKNKLCLELYLQRILIFLDYSINIKKMIINIDLVFKEDLIIFFKNYLYYFYTNYIISNKNNNNKEITTIELKIIIKLIKIFCLYFNILYTNNNINNSIYSAIKNKIENILYSLFIINNKENASLYEILINIFLYFVDLEDHNSNKICKLIMDLFNYIFTQTTIELNNNNSFNDNLSYNHIFEIKKFLIESKNIHRTILPYLDEENYPFLLEQMLNFIKNILFFCEEWDKYESGKNSIFEKIRKDLIYLDVLNEIENIECDSEYSNLKSLAEFINNNFFSIETKIENFS